MTSVPWLLALLNSFTSSIGLSRYETRRELVVKEDAIGITWPRMQLPDPPERARMEALLSQYADARNAFGRARIPAEERLPRHGW